jgi:hypothetical protein
VVPSQNLVWIRMGENPDGLDVPILMIDDIWQLINALPCTPNTVEITERQGIEVVPNPATTHWTIHSKSPIQSFKLSDMHGLTMQTELTAGASSIRLDANHLPCGNYIATIYLQDGSVMRARLVKA